MLARLAAARRAALPAQRSVALPSQCRRGLAAKPTMALIKELREQTGAPIVDVKAALVESGCDVGEARAWLRQKGLAKAQKKAGRATAEGLVAVAADAGASRAALVELCCETDFVARNGAFQQLADQLARGVLDLEPGAEAGLSPAELAAQLAATPEVAEPVALCSATMGENITLRRAGRLALPEGSDGVVSWYVHGAHSATTGGIASAVVLSAEGGSLGAEAKSLAGEYGKRLAMQVVAAQPSYVHRAAVPQVLLDAETASVREECAKVGEGKPANVLERMMEGKLNKWFEGIVLVDQKGRGFATGAPSADDTTDKKKLDKMAVHQIITKCSKAAGVPSLSVGPEMLHFEAGADLEAT